MYRLNMKAIQVMSMLIISLMGIMVMAVVYRNDGRSCPYAFDSYAAWPDG